MDKPCETCGLPMTDEESQALYEEIDRLRHNTKVDWVFVAWVVEQSDYENMDKAWEAFGNRNVV